VNFYKTNNFEILNRKLKAAERWRMNGQNTEVADKFNYPEVGWN
jgi:hypothetical protein